MKIKGFRNHVRALAYACKKTDLDLMALTNAEKIQILSQWSSRKEPYPVTIYLTRSFKTRSGEICRRDIAVKEVEENKVYHAFRGVELENLLDVQWNKSWEWNNGGKFQVLGGYKPTWWRRLLSFFY